ncbi:MAG: hypothetical protein CMM01_02895 [Rhodopirellula sp.]|nr:hypothetical protein [Rhodopirellula sp.]
MLNRILHARNVEPDRELDPCKIESSNKFDLLDVQPRECMLSSHLPSQIEPRSGISPALRD